MAERILCILGKLSSGGVESIMFSYYRFLDKSKYQYDFVYEESSDFDLPDDILSMGAGAFKVPDVSSPFAYMNAIEKIIKNGNYKIIHSNLNTLSVFSLFVAQKCKVKYRILHNHTTSSGVEKKRDLLKKVLRPFARMFANKHCACSDLAARWMYGDRAVDNGKATVFRNGVDVEKFMYSEDYRREIRREFNLENKKVIGHIGRFVTTKNHLFIIDTFCECLKKDKKSVLMLVGNGELFEDVKSYAKEKGIEDSVIFTGVRNDVHKLYSAFDVFILPSLYEGLPVVGMEACASGVPVIFADTITRECAISENISFLPITDPALWADKIQSVNCADREAEAVKMVSGSYNIRRCVKELEEYYSALN